MRVQEACTLLVLSSGYRQPLTLLQGPARPPASLPLTPPMMMDGLDEK